MRTGRRAPVLGGALLALAACQTPVPSYIASEIPAQQSICERDANAYAARHPDWWKVSLMVRPDFPPFPFWGTAPPPREVLPYRDDISGITFSVEADGRHVTATSEHGAQLWVHDPWVGANMCPYRSAHPFIFEIGPVDGRVFAPASADPSLTTDAAVSAMLVKDWKDDLAEFGCHPGIACAQPQAGDRFVLLTFNSSQYGYMNIRTGDFRFAGQN